MTKGTTTGPKNPLLAARSRRILFGGVAGRVNPDDEDLAMRAIRRAERQIKREQHEELRREQRQAAVERRKLHQMRAAEYARDRRKRDAERS